MREFIEVMAKHLPPSSSNLRLLDIGGDTINTLQSIRLDLEIVTTEREAMSGDEQLQDFDAVVHLGEVLDSNRLAKVLDSLRPGGRLIIVNTAGNVDQKYVRDLEAVGYTRILVEPAIGSEGVLIRGEKPHTTQDTLQRIQSVASLDDNSLNLENYRGRYIYLLVRQSPNVPVWRLADNEIIRWDALAVQQGDEITLLAFSSLPKAVGFMQPAILSGLASDINKMGKFSLATAKSWDWTVMLNPEIEILQTNEVTYIEVDPQTAEAPDE